MPTMLSWPGSPRQQRAAGMDRDTETRNRPARLRTEWSGYIAGPVCRI